VSTLPPTPEPGRGGLDLSPLTAPVDRAALRAFIAWAKAQSPNSVTTGLATMFWVTCITILLIQVITATIFLVEDGRVPLAILLAGPVIIAVYALIQLLRWLPRRPRWRQRYLVARFAQANGLAFADSIRFPSHPGMIFSLGIERTATSVVQLPDRRTEVGNFRYIDNTDSRSRMRRWGYAMITLDVPLPHIVLDARRNDRPFRSNLPEPPTNDQRLSLEGDVDRHFSLYCPKGYEADALYLFTPDVLAHLIDQSDDFDVEIVDDRLYLYSPHDMSTADPRRWERMLRIVEMLRTKLDQWARWRDVRLPERSPSPATTATAFPPVPPAGVAEPGRRLRKSVSWIAIVFGILYLIFGIVIQFL